jgi:four helix bundle protein
MAYGSAREVEYQFTIAYRLNYLSAEQFDLVHAKAVETSKVLGGLIRSIRGKQ